ncbi:hypothetical protein [Ferrimonas marina]|uniref:Uncharacterized protein n=1 Tax=Ferrimonas marina TaxID=299255 RepID=A0A1M5TIL6_9GAMM|nr:hypothetical protein [Ferrimonas marina]SHH50510.1 hypothetical protein SAMN02745129_2158 [Ferrimonas marina]
MKVGVCIFDHTDTATSGWRSSEGSEAERIDSISELATDTMWVTNLPYYDFRKLNLHRSPNIVDAQYFRSSIKLLTDELGLGETPDRLASVLSGFFSRMIAVAESNGISVQSPDYRYLKSLGLELATSLLRKRPRGAFGKMLKEVWSQSTQQNQAMQNAMVPRGANAYAFTLPRGAYFRWILSQNFPSATHWEKHSFGADQIVIGVQDGVKLPGTTEAMAALKDLMKTKAGFFRLSVQSMDPHYQKFSAYGSGSNVMRGYASLPEILRLSQYSKIAIGDGWKADCGKLEFPERFDMAANEFSFSRGLLFENVFAAYGSSSLSDTYFPSITAYLRAYDRIACSYFAEAFQEFNFSVGSYSTGKIMVYVRPQEVTQVVNLALSLGLLPPMDLLMVAEGVEVDNAKYKIPPVLRQRIDQDYICRLYRGLASRPDKLVDALVKMDRVVLEPRAERAKSLTAVLASLQQ